MLVLAIDVGSSSVKTALLRNERTTLSSKAEFPTHYAGRRVEVDAVKMMEAVTKAVRDLGSAAKNVDLIAPTAMAASWVAMDRTGKPLTPIITHQDRRSVDIALELERRIGKARHLKLAGNRPFPGGISSTTAAWFAKHHKGVLRQAATIGHITTLLHRQWTGQRVTDPSNASFMGVYNTTTLEGWNDELCDACGISPDQLPEVRDANEVAGLLSPLAASRSGLRAGTPILTGCMDTSAAILAAGAKPGHLLNSCGSTDVLAVCTTKAHPHERLLTRALGIGRTWMSVSTIAAAGTAVAWVRKMLFADVPEKKFFALLEKLPDRAGVTSQPYFAGDRLDLEQKQASFSGVTLSTTREHILAAVVDAIAKQSAERLPLLRKVTKLAKNVTVTGGGAESDVFHRDWGRGWRFVRKENLTVLGLAKLAAMAK
jgi:sugar (pentulose or hexulose) kinase